VVERDARQVAIALVALTALGFGLRCADMGQSLFGDERYTYSIVTQNGLHGVWHQVYTTSITPPLHYFVAWLAVQFGGDPTVTIRIPSLILGTALIPLTFLIARRVGGVRLALLAAGFMALSPFAVFYSTEARAYELMTFLVALSTFALLKAGDDERKVWLVVHALAAAGALWAHYTAAFVLVAQAAWALWTRRVERRRLVVAEAAIVVLFLPWLPGYLHQRHNPGVSLFTSFSPLTAGSIFGFPLRTLVGHPFLGLAAVPGSLGIGLVAVLLALAIAAAPRLRAARLKRPSLRSERALLVILAVATPVGLLAYAAVGPTLFSAPRELSASQPALMIVVALLVDSLLRAAPMRAGAPLLAASAVLLGVIAVKAAGAHDQRPAYRNVAHYLDGVSGSNPVVEFHLALSADARLRQSGLSLYFKRPHPLYSSGQGDTAAWRRAEAGGSSVYYVQPMQPAWLHYTGYDRAGPALRARIAKLGGPDGRAIERDSKTFAGFYPIVVRRYQGAVAGRLEQAGGQETITWTFGKHVSVSPGLATGGVELMTPSNGPLLTGGWALSARTRSPVDWFLLFSNGRLFAVSAGGLPSKPAAQAVGKTTSLLAGFAVGMADAPPDHSKIRVFAVIGDTASELPLTESARRSLLKG
jgi:4-amino-4-deoxy-L-arabinose transferase-like glycosyltransferase